MKNLLLLGATFLVASAVTVLDEEWNIWKSKYEKEYTNRKQETFRRQIWEANWQKVQKHNRLAEQGLKNYTMAMNNFADKVVTVVTDFWIPVAEQFVPNGMGHVGGSGLPVFQCSKSLTKKSVTSRPLGYSSPWNGSDWQTVEELMRQKTPCNSWKEETNPTPQPALSASCEIKANAKFPDQVDWRESGCVTPVKDAGLLCSSWWAFATVSVLESRYCIKNKRLLTFSEQQLVDCDDSNDGCCGGDFTKAFKHVSEKGIMENKDYEYKQSQSKCLYKPKEAVQINITKYYELSDEENIAKAVAMDGPVAVIFVVTQDFFLYNGGIYDGDCFPGQPFGMTIVGYGSSCESAYWILKNSMGKEWGEDGYVRVKRNVNHCSIGQSVKAIDIADPA